MSPQLSYQEGYKYVTEYDYSIQTHIFGFEVEHEFFSLSKEGLLTIFARYAWDGASGPTFDGPDNMVGSLGHDCLFQMLRLGLLPNDPCFHLANRELQRICVEDGMNPIRAKLWYDGVELFGSAHAALRPDIILTAPVQT